MNKENAISKINSIGKAGSIISKIAIVFLIVASVASVVFGIILTTVPKEDFVMTFENNAAVSINVGSKVFSNLLGISSEAAATEIAKGSMTVNDTEYSFIDAEYDENSKTLNCTLKGDTATITSARFVLVTWLAAVYAVLNIALFFFVKKLCDALKQCRSPFEESIITGIQHLAWALIPWAVLGSIFESILSTAFSGTIQAGFDLNIPTVFVILLLFGLAYVFKYGAVLQTESDETL